MAFLVPLTRSLPLYGELWVKKLGSRQPGENSCNRADEGGLGIRRWLCFTLDGKALFALKSPRVSPHHPLQSPQPPKLTAAVVSTYNVPNCCSAMNPVGRPRTVGGFADPVPHLRSIFDFTFFPPPTSDNAVHMQASFSANKQHQQGLDEPSFPFFRLTWMRSQPVPTPKGQAPGFGENSGARQKCQLVQTRAQSQAIPL